MDKNTHPRAEGAQSDADQWVKVRYETHGNGSIAIVQFDRGHASNTLAVALCRKLRQVAQSFESDTTLSAVILTGRADNFSMGADLRDPERKGMEQAALSARRLQYQTGGKRCRAWEEIEPLTIAAIEGWCVGARPQLPADLARPMNTLERERVPVDICHIPRHGDRVSRCGRCLAGCRRSR